MYIVYNTMSPLSLPQRHNFKWNITELLSLQREYQLLEMTIQDISERHGRTIPSILYRLQQEGFIETWIDARGYQEFSKTQKYLVGSLDSGEKLLFVVGAVIEDDEDDLDSDYVEEDEEYIVDDEEEEEEDDSDYEDVSEEEEDDSKYEKKNISSLSQRVWNLETAVTDIRNMVEKLFNKFTTQ